MVLELHIAGWVIAQQDLTTQQLTSINGVRIANGLPPYALNERLSASAQEHSEDMAANDLNGLIGSDNSTVEERIAAAGYPAYSTGILGGEATHTELAESLDWWMDSPAYRELVLNTRYREIGIGIARRPTDGRLFWTLDFGAQPNVLPFFINYGASQTDDPNVILILSNEGGMIYGDGPTVMGLANEVRVSNTPAFHDAVWQPWAPQIEWSLPPGEGLRTIYVEYRDQEGRTTSSQTSVTLTQALPSSSATGTPLPSRPPAASVPSPLPSQPIPPTRSTVTPSAPTALPYPQPASPMRKPVPFTHWLVIRPEDALPWVCGLQVIAALLGFFIAARRQQPASEHHKAKGEKRK